MARLSLCVLVLTLVLSGCSSREAAEGAESSVPAPAPLGAATSAELAVDIFIENQRRGDLAGVRSVLFPPNAPFDLDGPVEIEYTVQATRLLNEEQAELESMDGPRRQAGDVMIDVLEHYAGGRSKTVTYYVREFDGVWKIYGWGYWLDK